MEYQLSCLLDGLTVYWCKQVHCFIIYIFIYIYIYICIYILTLTVKCFIVRSCFCPNILILKRELYENMQIYRRYANLTMLQRKEFMWNRKSMKRNHWKSIKRILSKLAQLIEFLDMMKELLNLDVLVNKSNNCLFRYICIKFEIYGSRF